MNKKIYIASSLKNYKRIIELREKFLKLGVELTYDWAESYKNVVEKGAKTEETDLQLSRIAEEEWQAVRRCDVLLFVNPAGRGAHVELGMAYALGKPIVILDETGGKEKIAFHLLFSIQRNESEEDAIKDVLRLLG